METASQSAVLFGVALAAAIVTGALGYGFSSMTVPVALLFISGRVLNPALVPIELAMNVYLLFVCRRELPVVAPRVAVIVIAVLPGVILGTLLLSRVAPEAIRLGTYGVLLPLVLLQVVGWRRAVSRERLASLPFGLGLGALYSTTTISGPPLALFFNNQGYTKDTFRASIAVVRVAESALTALAYASVGLYTPTTNALLTLFIPAVALGVPVGAWLITRVEQETFRRVCMGFDGVIVAFGLFRTLDELDLMPGPWAYASMALIDVFVAAVLWRHLRRRSHAAAPGT